MRWLNLSKPTKFSNSSSHHSESKTSPFTESPTPIFTWPPASRFDSTSCTAESIGGPAGRLDQRRRGGVRGSKGNTGRNRSAGREGGGSTCALNGVGIYNSSRAHLCSVSVFFIRTLRATKRTVDDMITDSIVKDGLGGGECQGGGG